MSTVTDVILVVLVLSLAAAIYLHFFVWPTMVESVSNSNRATLEEFAKHTHNITWWYRDRSLAAHVRKSPMVMMEIGAWRASMPDMAGALRGCDILSSTHLRWKDVDVRFYDIVGDFVTLDGSNVYPADAMIPIEEHVPTNARCMVNVILPGDPRPHETLRAMYRTMNVMSEKEDGQVSPS